MNLTYSEDKDRLLKKKRGVSFTDVIKAFDFSLVLDNIRHPNKKKYPKQMIFVVNIKGYIYLVPYIKEGEVIFMKTIYPSRKYTKKYLGK